MKKLATLFFFFLFISNLPNTQTVFKEVESNKATSYHTYEITFKEHQMTTKALPDFIRNLQVIQIEPYVNPIYKSKISLEIQSYSFTSDTLIQNIQNFTQKYNQELKIHGFYTDLSKQQITGISIHKIEIFCGSNEIGKLNQNVIEFVQKIIKK